MAQPAPSSPGKAMTKAIPPADADGSQSAPQAGSSAKSSSTTARTQASSANPDDFFNSLLVVVIYLAALGVLYFKQRDFQYDPTGKVMTLAETKLTQAQAVAIPTTDGAVVNGWYEAPAIGK